MRTGSSELRLLLHLTCAGLFAAGAWAAMGPGTAKKAPPKKTIDYNRDVRPILSKCFTCHGHDPKAVAAGLRLDDGPSAKRKLKSGFTAIVPFHPEQSRLIKRIYAPVEEMLMPPKSSNKTLSSEEKSILKQWILEGAEYKEHWAFVPPVRPALPKVKNKTWVKNGIDTFILEKIEGAGLKPSAQADRRTLIRRATLDLTGLPPTPAEVEAFVTDKSPNAYEKVVDRLLASPRYGERMAMDWMDYARYADSNGYQADFERFQWRWRDWVIDAFNRNMPYDQFTVEQIAGDMLPNATMNQRLATGFNRNHRINTEGGVVLEEWRVENVIDRVETTSQVWLGLTAGCARCHDHKYDPLTQKDFYSLFAYFNNVPETGSGEERPVNHPPVMAAPTPEQSARMQVLTRSLADLQTKVDGIVAARSGEVKDWKVASPWSLPSIKDGLLAHYRLSDSPIAETGPAPKAEGKLTYGLGRSSGAVKVGDDGYLDLGSVGDFDTHDPFSYSLWLKPERGGASPLSRMDSNNQYRGWDLFLNNDRPAVHVISSWPENAMKVVSKQAIPLGKWSHVAVSYDGSAKPEGVKIYIDGKAVPTEPEGDPALTGSIRTNVTTKIGRRTPNDAFRGEIDDVAIFGRVLRPEEARELADIPEALPLLSIPEGDRTDAQRLEIGKMWLRDHDTSFRDLLNQEQSLQRERTDLEGQISTVMVMDEMSKPRKAYVLIRGQYDKHGDEVQAELPAFLRIPGKTFPKNRLGLARWMVDPKNPLTARVTVNRLWDRFFGAGLVATVEDFGTRADFPTHPELLDWMATEFMSRGWNLKSMIKEIVMSATYRQSSVVSAALLKADPTNRLLARGPRFRLPAEVLRDQAMYVGGMLSEHLGGPSVRPYQPDGVWDEVNVYGNLRNYRHDEGPNLHRRSLYTIWKRTAAPPTMTLFDVPSRETCRVRRARTNTPLQALTMLNDVTYVESARALALRMLREGGETAASRLSFAFKNVLARAPLQEEKKVLLDGLARRLAHYRSDRKAADEVLLQGDLLNDPWLDNAEAAAYTVLASTILNMDEAVTRE